MTVPRVPRLHLVLTRRDLRTLLADAWEEGFRARADSTAQDVPSPPNPYQEKP